MNPASPIHVHLINGLLKGLRSIGREDTPSHIDMTLSSLVAQNITMYPPGRQEPVRYLSKPSYRDAAELIMNCASRKKPAVVLGSCEVRWKSRSSSYLGDGERIVLMKEDGSVLVHQTWGYKPVVLQPPGSMISVTSGPRSVSVSAWRKTGGETMQIDFSRVYGVIELNFWDESLTELDATEVQMKEAASYAPELIERDLRPIAQQLPIRSGFVDMLALDSKDRLVAVAFKHITARSQDVNQLIAYVARLRGNCRKRAVRGVLVAPGVNKVAKRLLKRGGLEFKSLELGRCTNVHERLKRTIQSI